MLHKFYTFVCASFIFLSFNLSAQEAPADSKAPSEEVLSNQELKKLIAGNTFHGQFKDSKRSFAIYFSPDGTVYLQKAGDPFTHYGKWKISQTMLYTPWPYEDLPITNKNKWLFYQRRDLRKYYLEFRQVNGEVYEPYKVRSCSCDPSPEFAFPTCSWHEGQVPLS